MSKPPQSAAELLERYKQAKDTSKTAHFQKAVLKGANLEGVVLNQANLEASNLEEANLKGAKLKMVNLEKAELSEADLKGADLYRANLTGANLQMANLKGANLFGADLHKANLKGANLIGANLESVRLSEADLKGAVLYEANLTGANLQMANLKGTNLINAGMIGTDLRKASYDDDTRWPFIWPFSHWLKGARRFNESSSFKASLIRPPDHRPQLPGTSLANVEEYPPRGEFLLWEKPPGSGSVWERIVRLLGFGTEPTGKLAWDEQYLYINAPQPQRLRWSHRFTTNLAFEPIDEQIGALAIIFIQNTEDKSNLIPTKLSFKTLLKQAQIDSRVEELSVATLWLAPCDFVCFWPMVLEKASAHGIRLHGYAPEQGTLHAPQ